VDTDQRRVGVAEAGHGANHLGLVGRLGWEAEQPPIRGEPDDLEALDAGAAPVPDVADAVTRRLRVSAAQQQRNQRRDRDRYSSCCHETVLRAGRGSSPRRRHRWYGLHGPAGLSAVHVAGNHAAWHDDDAVVFAEPPVSRIWTETVMVCMPVLTIRQSTSSVPLADTSWMQHARRHGAGPTAPARASAPRAESSAHEHPACLLPAAPMASSRARSLLCFDGTRLTTRTLFPSARDAVREPDASRSWLPRHTGCDYKKENVP